MTQHWRNCAAQVDISAVQISVKHTHQNVIRSRKRQFTKLCLPDRCHTLPTDIPAFQISVHNSSVYWQSSSTQL